MREKMNAPDELSDADRLDLDAELALANRRVRREPWVCTETHPWREGYGTPASTYSISALG